MSKFPFNEGQEKAIEAAIDHVENSNGGFIIIKGPAGTGKTSIEQEFIRRLDEFNFIVTAPTNKAAKVSRDMIVEADLPKPPGVGTIYSALGLRMMADGEVKKLSGVSDDLDMRDCDVVVVDEMGMLGTPITRAITHAAAMYPSIRWILTGDQFQLPPVKEVESMTWGFGPHYELTQVMRTDNQILTAATRIRRMVEDSMAGLTPRLELKEDYDDEGGVLMPRRSLDTFMEAHKEDLIAGKAKAVAWRNVTVNNINAQVRDLIYGEGAPLWVPGDRVTLLAQAKNFNDEVIAHTDDEGTVIAAEPDYHPIWHRMKIWRLWVRMDHGAEDVTLFQSHPDGEVAFKREEQRLKDEAYKSPSKWGEFWLFKESFHEVRHAYATTAHRAQGSTHSSTYVDWRDVMSNKNRMEALRCLYVAVSRPKHRLYL